MKMFFRMLCGGMTDFSGLFPSARGGLLCVQPALASTHPVRCDTNKADYTTVHLTSR